MLILNDGITPIEFKTRPLLAEYLTRTHALPENEANKSLAVLNGRWDGFEYKLNVNGKGYLITVKRVKK